MSSRRPPWLAEDERQWDHITVHRRVLQHPDLSIYERGVYCVLAWHANTETGESRPGQPTIGKEAGCSERKVREAIVILEATRLIAVIREPGKPIIYRLLSPPKEPVRLAESGAPECPTPAPRAALPPAGGAVLQTGPWHHVPVTPAPRAALPRHHVPQNNKESLNEKETKATSTSALSTSKAPKAKPAPKPKAPPHPETAALVSYFVELADTPTLKRSRARMGAEIKKALDGGSAAGDIRVTIERVVREGNPGGFGRLLNGVERQHSHRLAPADSPLARGVLALAKAAKSGERWDGDEPQSLGDIAQRFDLGAAQ